MKQEENLSNPPKDEKKSKGNIGKIILLIGLLLIAVGVALITFFPSNEEESTTKQPQEETQFEQTNRLGQTIDLSQETEEINFDEKLKINFIGNKSTDIDNAYKYKAEIYLNDTLINHNFYTGENIYSKDYAANITVTKLKDVYIINSFIAKRCNGSDILVIKDDQTQINSYTDVSIVINQEVGNYVITKCSDCMDSASCQNTTIEVS